jgi:hypothetical protein
LFKNEFGKQEEEFERKEKEFQNEIGEQNHELHVLKIIVYITSGNIE